MAPRTKNPNVLLGKKKKATYEEKGKRKAPPSDSSDSSATPPPPKRQSRVRGPGIRIQEGIPNPQIPIVPKSFLEEKDERVFNSEIAKRKFTKCKYVNFNYFRGENFVFPTWFDDYGLEVFLSYHEHIYDELVRLFYFYLKWDAKIKRFTSYVKGVYIAFTEKEFADILSLPYDEEEDEDDVSLEDKILLLTGNPVISHLETSFHTRELGSVEFRVLFHIVSNCLFPRAGGFDKIYNDDVGVMYAIVHGLKRQLSQSMLKFMMDQKKRKNGNLPFAMVLTRLFIHFKVNLRKEHSYEVDSYSIIQEGTLHRMRLVKLKGQWIDKSIAKSQTKEASPSPPKERRQEAQEQETEQEQRAERNEEEGQVQEGTTGFDHFSMSDLLGATHPLPNFSPSPTHPPPPLHASHTSVAPVDLSPLFSFLESQFAHLNSRIDSLECKVDAVNTDFTSFKSEVSTKLSETQEKMDIIASTFGNHCPRISQSVQEVSDYLDLHTKQMNQAMITASTCLQDIRDNTDKVCLKYKIPSLQEILRDLDAQVRREYRTSRRPNRKPPPKPQPQPQPSQPPSPPVDPLSDSAVSDSTDSSDPDADQVRSESE